MDYNHRRILRIRLLLIEADLRDIISKLTDNTDTSSFILYSVKNTLDSDSKKNIHTIVDCMLDEISIVKEVFALESEEQSPRSKIFGRLNEIWTTLLDTTPQRLAAYGDISDSDQKSLKLIIVKLLHMTEEIYKVLEQPH
jgi:hypothetical protein